MKGVVATRSFEISRHLCVPRKNNSGRSDFAVNRGKRGRVRKKTVSGTDRDDWLVGNVDYAHALSHYKYGPEPMTCFHRAIEPVCKTVSINTVIITVGR